jgi:hypothetical protein
MPLTITITRVRSSISSQYERRMSLFSPSRMNGLSRSVERVRLVETCHGLVSTSVDFNRAETIFQTCAAMNSPRPELALPQFAIGSENEGGIARLAFRPLVVWR